MKLRLLCSAVLMAGLMSSPAFAGYTQDFEGLTVSPDETTPPQLASDGWLVGANVYDSGGGFLYNYFAFPAPNHGNAFSAVVTGQGGPNQGNNQLSVFSDYANTGAHGAGELVESFVFRDIQGIGAGDVGQTFNFHFDAKAGNIAAPTTATAYIKTLDAGFNEVDVTSVALEGIGTAWTEGNTLSLTVSPAAVGGLLQVGFTNTATNFDPSGMYYDNIVVPEPGSLAALAIGSTIMVVRRRRRS